VSQYPPNMYSDTPDGLEHSEITNRLENAHRVGSRIRFTALLDIAHHVNTQSLQGDQAIVVFNGKAEPYTGIVKVLITTDSKDNVAPVITDQSGTRLGITITEMSDSTFRSWFDVQFIATVPALGYTTYCVYMEKTEGLPVISAGVSTGYEAVTTDIHDGSLPLSTSIVTSSDPGFHITAVKPPEEAERSGMIVRGYNVGGEPLWVTLTPWRPFAAVEVMTIDESPTGGKLVAESNGAVYFKAGPHRILTFWFHD
jgi:hypothetical protein